jgi:hypothetical protein
MTIKSKWIKKQIIKLKNDRCKDDIHGLDEMYVIKLIMSQSRNIWNDWTTAVEKIYMFGEGKWREEGGRVIDFTMSRQYEWNRKLAGVLTEEFKKLWLLVK